MLRYFKLGKNASIFFCPKTRLKIGINQVGSLDAKKVSKKILDAMSNGHIVEITKDEYEQMQKDQQANKANNKTKVSSKPAEPKKEAPKTTDTPSTDNTSGSASSDEDEDQDDQGGEDDKLKDLDKDALIAYAETNCDGITKKELKKLSDMTEEAIRNFIKNF